MAEFKLAPELLTEIAAFSSTGTALNDEYARLEEGTLSTLSTSQQYLQQHAQIKELIDAYIELIRKDVKDLLEMHRATTGMDATIAGAYRK